MMQQHRMEQHDEKLNQMKEQMRKFDEEKGIAFNDLIETKILAKETIAMVNTREQNGIKDNNNGSLKHESKKGLEQQLSEKDYKRKFKELEAELEKRKESEANLFDTLVMQTKQLEQNKVLLEESKVEIASLEEKLKALQVDASANTKSTSPKEGLEGMKNEGISKKAKTLVEELNVLKGELKSATKAEENSKKAMDDLAFALKEVATEANQVKAKLTLSQVELEHTKGDAERWKTMLENTEDKYKELLDVTKKEADRFKNTAERLRLEAEESLLAWNGKEMEFVNCIKRTEEERARVVELLKEAENKTKVSKEENQKLRDILKQALNEANVAKEAAEIAKAENARLQDSLNLLVHENEMLKIHEAASFENIKELKRMLSESSSSSSSIKEFKNEEMERERSSTKEKAKDQNKEHKNLSKTFSLNLKDMITTHKQQHKVGNEEVVNKEAQTDDDDDDTLRGSIFDDVDSSSESESRHEMEMGIHYDFDHLDDSHFDDSEGGSTRKRRALLRRFGDLIRRRGNHYNHRKEPSNEEHLQT